MSTPHDRVRALRAFTGLSPTQFAERVGCTRQMVVYVERGERRPGVDMVHAIEALSVAPRADGEVWSKGPLSTEEWISTGAPSTHDTAPLGTLDPATPVQTPEEIDAAADLGDSTDTAA